MGEKYDFSGWATKNDLKCSDGRTIRKNAFEADDGMVVPLVWQHMHDSPENVLGHALLKNMPDGVYAYGKFNNTENGQNAKLLVAHGDVTRLSIWANQLKQMGGDVLHGKIREVSLVLSGANPGAFIDYPILEHGEESETEAVIYTGELIHTEGGEVPDKEPEVEEEKLEHKEEGEDMKENEINEELQHAEGEKTIKEIFDSMTEEQKNVVYALVGAAAEGKLGDEEDSKDDEEEKEAKHSDWEDENDMKHNVFDSEETRNDGVLSHSDMETIFKDAKRLGSLRDAVNEFTDNAGIELMHDDTPYGIQERPSTFSNTTYGIDALFPDYKALNVTPEFLSRRQEWVGVVMNGVHHTPFSRIKSMFADITADEARAKGYTKGKKKLEEVFTLLKRTTDPQTIYKKQKLDRDDIIDITDFDVVAWIKREMRVMLDEEIARAILIGDGRSSASDDHISELHIRPIAKDDELFNIVVNTTDDPKEQIKAIIRARKNYKGTGNPTFFTTEDVLTEMLLLEDEMGRSLYKTEQELATKLRVSRIVTVEVFENQKIDGKDLIGVVVNLADYNVGADKGGAVSMFDDFDIDYNQQKYLIETRISGALIKPFSAMTVLAAPSGATGATGATGSTAQG